MKCEVCIRWRTLEDAAKYILTEHYSDLVSPFHMVERKQAIVGMTRVLYVTEGGIPG